MFKTYYLAAVFNLSFQENVEKNTTETMCCSLYPSEVTGNNVWLDS